MRGFVDFVNLCLIGVLTLSKSFGIFFHINYQTYIDINIANLVNNV